MKELNVVVERTQGYFDLHLGTAMQDMERRHYDNSYYVQSFVVHLLRLMRNDGQHVNVKYVNMPALELMSELRCFREDFSTVESMDSVDIRIILTDKHDRKTNNNILFDVDNDGDVIHIGKDVWKHFCSAKIDAEAMHKLTQEALNTTQYTEDINVESIDPLIILPF